MRNLVAALCFLALVSVDGRTAPPAALMDCSSTGSVPPATPQSTSTPAPQVIVVGEEVTGLLPLVTPGGESGATEMLFELTAPSDGTLIAELDWDPDLGHLTLSLDDVRLDYWPPAIGALQVVAGQTYRVSVSASIDSWYYYYYWSFVPFVLKTSILPGVVGVPLGCQSGPPAPDWICVDGGWVPPDHPLAQGGVLPPAPPPPSSGATGCRTIQPMSNWVCVNGGWLPPDHPLTQGSVMPPAPPPPSGGATGCQTIQPVSSWVCVNGGWVPPDHPLAIVGPPSSPPAPPAPAPAPVVGPGCTTVQPAAAWVCVNGGWLPPDHPFALSATTNPTLSSPTGCMTPDPFIGLPGLVGVCVDGNWVPSSDPPAAAPPVPAPVFPPTGSALLWVMVTSESGVCIDGATIQIVRAEGVGDPIPQATPCSVWDVGGGLLLTDLTPGVEVTLRGAASGYEPREMSFLPFPTPGGFQAVSITLSKAQ